MLASLSGVMNMLILFSSQTSQAHESVSVRPTIIEVWQKRSKVKVSYLQKKQESNSNLCV